MDQAEGWELDYKKFRTFLRDSYDVQTAYLFMGFLPEYSSIYARLQSQGYIIIFKPTVKMPDGTVKGNCDSDLVLQAMIDYNDQQFNKAVIVSSDGDFYCLINYFIEQGKLHKVLSPRGPLKCSSLIKQKASNYLVFLNDVRNKIEKK